LDRLIDSVLTKSDGTSSSKDNKRCNIKEVMKKLYSIDEINFSDDLHTFSTKLFCLGARGWVAIGDIDRKFYWLKRMFDRSLKI